MPITTTEQRDALQAAHHLAGTGSLIPANKTYIQQQHVYDGQCKAAGLSHMHGLRHQYAQNRYETLTGRPPPTAGGPITELSPTQRIEDRHARQTIISRELGHERVQITAIYLGSWSGSSMAPGLHTQSFHRLNLQAQQSYSAPLRSSYVAQEESLVAFHFQQRCLNRDALCRERWLAKLVHQRWAGKLGALSLIARFVLPPMKARLAMSSASRAVKLVFSTALGKM